VRLGSGKVVVAGRYRTSPGTFELGLVRFDADGLPDESFGPMGLVTQDLGGTSDYTGRIRRAGTKLLVATAHFVSSSESHLGVVRLSAGGDPDAAFGDQGLALAPLTASLGTSLAVQGDGKIVVAGNRTPTEEGSKFMVARFLAS
jgi:uncharacterized delta-60 repeat protein